MSYGTSPQQTMMPFQPTYPQQQLPPLTAPAAAPVQQTRILHLKDFATTLKTRDIQAVFSEWEDDRGGFKIKWIDDKSCYIVFADPNVAKRAFLSILCNMPVALIHTPSDPEAPAAKLTAYAGDDTPNILASVQQRPRARSNAGQLHNRRTSTGQQQNGRRESIGDMMGSPPPGQSAQIGDAGRRMIAGGLGRPFASVAGGQGSPQSATAQLSGSAVA